MTSSHLTSVTVDADAPSTAGAGGSPGIAAMVADVLPMDLPGDDDVADALVAAGREAIEAFGIRRLRMDDVARRAGYGRATLYRRFATRDDLVWAVVTREVQATLLAISVELADVPHLRDRVVEAFVVTIQRVRGNALMRRLLEIEPDLLLPHLTTRGSGALLIARRLMTDLLRHGKDRGELPGIDVESAAEMVVRLAHSLLLCPEGPIDVDDPDALRRFARASLADPLFEWSRPTGTHA